MPTVGLLFHTGRPSACRDACALARWLVSIGCEVRLPPDAAEASGLHDLACDDADLPVGLDLAVSLGGDGSMLHSVARVADHGVPVLGINYGSLGYLTTAESTEARRALERVLAGDHAVEERMRLEVTIGDGERRSAGRALNEAIVEKIESGRTVEYEVTVDGEPWMAWAADGVIVCTPTGSTAYSLSAGGPIVAPTHEALVVTPVAPHSLFDRSVVLPPDSEISVAVRADRPASVAIDGRAVARLDPDQAMICTASDQPARLVQLGESHFGSILAGKFGLHAR